MSLRVYSTAVLLTIVAAGCVTPNKRAVEYRNKGRERFKEGNYELSVANYRQAKVEDKAGKIDGLESERERAASEKVKVLLKDAWSKFDRGEFQQAHAQLMLIKAADPLANKITDPIVLRSLGDTAAMAWEEVDQYRKRKFYLRAMLLAEYLVKPLPAGHAMRVRYDALKIGAIGFHMAKMRQLKTTQPNAAAFHYLVARRLGGDSDIDGLELIAAVKRSSGDANTYNTNGKAASGAKAEDQFVLGRQLGNAWDPAAITLFGTAYGMNDARYLDEVWNGTATLEPYPALAAITIPAPDDVTVLPSVDPSSDSGPRYKSLDFYYTIGNHTLESKRLSTAAGGAYRFPSKTGKATYELSGFFESETLGGDSKGYGADLLITALVKSPLVIGGGIGYLTNELESEDPMFPAPATIKQKSVHVPIVARAPLGAGYGASLEARINILQFTKEKQPLPDGEQHYSPVSVRLYGPIPLVADAVPALRALQLEAFATYTKDAPEQVTYGGRLVYRSTLDGKDDGKDIWDKIEKSAFAVQTLVGPTWDFWFDLGTTPLTKDDKQHGMGTLFRIPNKDSGSVYEFSLAFQSSNLGGNVGGWGIEYILMKPVKKIGVLGFGLGYSSSSISDAPEMPPIDYKAPEQNSFHSPIVLRIPLGTAAILGVEGRLNYLALGGTGDPLMNEKRHFHYIGGRLWIPLPLLGDAISALSKFHLEGHIGYTPGGEREFNYGGMLIWRPIQTTRM
jgi:hypothetical protein